MFQFLKFESLTANLRVKPPAMQSQSIYSVNWYPNSFPHEHDAVTVKITRVDELGIWVQLLEYGCKEGMIPLGQFTTRKTRRIPKNVKVGKIDTALVSQVDEEKGNMDLTRQGLKEEDINSAEKRFNDYKSLMSLLAYVAGDTIPLEELVAKVSYKLQDQYENAYAALQSSNINPEILNSLDITDEVRESIREQIKRMFTPQEVRIHSTFEAEVLNSKGVVALKEALVSGYNVDNNPKLSINVIAPPIYSASINVIGEEAGIETLNKVLAEIEKNIIAAGGRFRIKEAPKSISQKEMDAIKNQLKEMAQDDANDDIDDADA